ncbi:neuromedin-K receptor-like [Teleopsis dalmanni]|uniref:neuromedin-K receptor-like n=1 Tax=Teleopsis dalmanni TaxID=139649 RepID=UPI0018CD2ED7|nr:neuromedin-K receptor-like [Teleopsis dalmanni]
MDKWIVLTKIGDGKHMKWNNNEKNNHETGVSVESSLFSLYCKKIKKSLYFYSLCRARPTKFVSKLIIVTIWIVSITFAIPCAIAFRVELVHERIREDGVIYNMTRPFCLNKNLSEEQLQTYRYSLVFVQYLVPFCVISFVYIQMAVKLWGTRTPGNAQDLRDMTLLRNKKKVIKMLIIVVIVFGLCWLPLQLYNILYVTIPEINEYHFISIIWFCCDWLAMSNSCYNPFIYGIYNEKFKREFNKRFAACFCKFKTSLDSHDRTLSMHTRGSSLRSSYMSSSMRMRNNIFSSSHQHPVRTAHCYRPGQMKIGKNGHNNIYNVMTFGNNTANNFNGGVDANIIVGVHDANNVGPLMYQWRRNNFKPLHPDVIENEDDMGLMELPSTPPSEIPSGTYGNTVDTIKSDSNESSSCICEQELGSRTECDGTCILMEVARVQAPHTDIVEATDKDIQF